MLHLSCLSFFFFNDTATTEIYTLSLHDALPICDGVVRLDRSFPDPARGARRPCEVREGHEGEPSRDRSLHALCLGRHHQRSEEHTSELQSRLHLVCRLLLEKKKRLRFRLWCSKS